MVAKTKQNPETKEYILTDCIYTKCLKQTKVIGHIRTVGKVVSKFQREEEQWLGAKKAASGDADTVLFLQQEVVAQACSFLGSSLGCYIYCTSPYRYHRLTLVDLV